MSKNNDKHERGKEEDIFEFDAPQWYDFTKKKYQKRRDYIEKYIKNPTRNQFQIYNIITIDEEDEFNESSSPDKDEWFRQKHPKHEPSSPITPYGPLITPIKPHQTLSHQKINSPFSLCHSPLNDKGKHFLLKNENEITRNEISPSSPSSSFSPLSIPSILGNSPFSPFSQENKEAKIKNRSPLFNRNFHSTKSPKNNSNHSFGNLGSPQRILTNKKSLIPISSPSKLSPLAIPSSSIPNSSLLDKKTRNYNQSISNLDHVYYENNFNSPHFHSNSPLNTKEMENIHESKEKNHKSNNKNHNQSEHESKSDSPPPPESRFPTENNIDFKSFLSLSPLLAPPILHLNSHSHSPSTLNSLLETNKQNNQDSKRSRKNDNTDSKLFHPNIGKRNLGAACRVMIPPQPPSNSSTLQNLVHSQSHSQSHLPPFLSLSPSTSKASFLIQSNDEFSLNSLYNLTNFHDSNHQNENENKEKTPNFPPLASSSFNKKGLNIPSSSISSLKEKTAIKRFKVDDSLFCPHPRSKQTSPKEGGFVTDNSSLIPTSMINLNNVSNGNVDSNNNFHFHNASQSTMTGMNLNINSSLNVGMNLNSKSSNSLNTIENIKKLLSQHNQKLRPNNKRSLV